MAEYAPEPIGKFKTPEEELAFLRSYVKEKEGALGKPEISPVEREHITKDSVREYAALKKEDVLTPEHTMPEGETEALVLKLSPESHDSKIEELYGMLLERGLKNTLAVVEKMNDPHIDDDFHRFLVALDLLSDL
jgi:hypothetical protein